MIAVINFGAQYIHLIARRVRELGVHSEVLPYNILPEELKRLKPKGIILSGGPASVNEKKAPLCDRRILELGVPVLGICYGHQLIGKLLNGRVSHSGLKEYGRRILSVDNPGIILKNFSRQEPVWMSHGDSVVKLPSGFKTLASTDSCAIAAFENPVKRIYGVQFHPEVVHTKKGWDVLKNFVFGVCRHEKDWHVGDMAKRYIGEVRSIVGQDHVIMGTSGGVDSTVAAVLVHRAIGKRLHCVFVDHGLIRKHELEDVKRIYNRLGLDVHYVDASKLFLSRLKGVTDPEKKRTIIGHAFIEVFEKKAKDLEKKYKDIKFLGQGTIYPDRIESAQPSKEASRIKSHHNVTLPEKMKLKVVEPLRDLYKDEVRILGMKLGLPRDILDRHPFPGPGLAVRILGEITAEKLRILRESDYIFVEELKKAGYYDRVWQAFAAFFPIKAVGVKGDARSYEYIISLRAVTSVDAMTADWAKLPYELLERIASRIVNEVRGVNRVVYDISQKPPATIEYE